MKKAVSALIATVIVVAFTVSVAVIVTSFMTGVIKFQTDSASSQAVCAQKGSLLIDTAMCTRVRDNSLVGYWKLDSVNASNYTADSSGYGNGGLMKNFANPPSQNFTAGQIANGTQFDGANDYVNVTSMSGMGVTVELWKKNGTDAGWLHLVNSSGTLYVNGAAGSGQVIPATNSSGTVIIGRDNSGNYFNGTIDEMKVYNRTLSADEILQHYQNGLQKFAVDGYFKTIKASVRNIGSTPLSNFTVFADINGRLYQNDTPLNGGLTLPAASEPLTLQAYTYYDGPIKTLKVSVLNCPISMTMTNDSAAVGTC
ncbi:MAG: LamG-like jellyroll fold domain-containing protein [Candidatus Aenigmatarchaeota archaeon]